MGICITIRFDDTPNGFENYLRRFMTRYYRSVEIRFGDIEDIQLDGSPTDGEGKQPGFCSMQRLLTIMLNNCNWPEFCR